MIRWLGLVPPLIIVFHVNKIRVQALAQETNWDGNVEDELHEEEFTIIGEFREEEFEIEDALQEESTLANGFGVVSEQVFSQHRYMQTGTDCQSRINHHRTKYGVPLITEREDLHTCVNRQSQYDKLMGAHKSWKRCGPLGSQGSGGGSNCAGVIDMFFNERWRETTTAVFDSPFATSETSSQNKCRTACMNDMSCLSYDYLADAPEGESCRFYNVASSTHIQMDDDNETLWLGHPDSTDTAPPKEDGWISFSVVEIDGAHKVPADGVINSFKYYASNANGVNLFMYRPLSFGEYQVVGLVNVPSSIEDQENIIDNFSPIRVQQGDVIGFTWIGQAAFGFSESNEGEIMYRHEENSGGPNAVNDIWTFDRTFGRKYHVAASFVPDESIAPEEPPRKYNAAARCVQHCGPVMGGTTTTFAWGEYGGHYSLNWRPGGNLPKGNEECPSELATVKCWKDEEADVLWAYGVRGEDCHSTCSLAGASSADYMCDENTPITNGFEEVSQIMENFLNPYNSNDPGNFTCTTGTCWGGASGTQVLIHEDNSDCYVPSNDLTYSCTTKINNGNCYGQRFNQLCPCIPGCSWAAGPNCELSNSPTLAPTASPTPEPTASPTKALTATPTPEPTASSTKAPTASPTSAPTASPTKALTAHPTPEPTAHPTPEPTASPTKAPTASPTSAPTASPTKALTAHPNPEPTASPTKAPTAHPTPELTALPTAAPTAPPTEAPTASPTEAVFKDGVDMEYDVMYLEDAAKVSFNDESDSEELSFEYLVSTGKEVAISLLKSDCTGNVASLELGPLNRQVDPLNDTITANIDVRQDLVQSDTDVYSFNELTYEGTLVFCMRLDLYAPTDTAHATSINFHETIVNITIDQRKGFTVENIATDRDEAQIKNETTKVNYNLASWKCDAEWNTDDSAISQGDIIRLCLETTSTNANLASVISLDFSQESGFSDSLIELGASKIYTGIEIQEAKRIMIRSAVVSDFFNQGTTDPIDVSGTVLWEFGGGSRKLSSNNLATNRLLAIVHEDEERHLIKSSETSEFRMTMNLVDNTVENNGLQGNSIADVSAPKSPKQNIGFLAGSCVALACIFLVFSMLVFRLLQKVGKREELTKDDWLVQENHLEQKVQNMELL